MASPKKVQSAPAPSNPFATAPEAPKLSKPKGKGKERTSIDLGADLDKLAAFKVLEKLLEGEGKMIQAQVRDQVISLFAEQAKESGKKPESFVGTGERSIASCELRRRGSNMPLTPEVAEELKQLDIPVEKSVKVPERFIISPDLDQATLEHLAKVVASDPKLKGKTVVMRQAEEYTYVVSEATIDGLATKASVETCKLLLEKVATFAIGKFQFDGVGIEGADKQVTPEAKAIALSLLQDMGVLPAAEVVVAAKKRA
jgi:hypothetical protein